MRQPVRDIRQLRNVFRRVAQKPIAIESCGAAKCRDVPPAEVITVAIQRQRETVDCAKVPDWV
jgi:hypothetical protein